MPVARESAPKWDPTAGRTVSWLMSMPGSNRRSSTCRSDSGERLYVNAVRPITSGALLK